jgi:hypothetical protein
MEVVFMRTMLDAATGYQQVSVILWITPRPCCNDRGHVPSTNRMFLPLISSVTVSR